MFSLYTVNNGGKFNTPHQEHKKIRSDQNASKRIAVSKNNH